MVNTFPSGIETEKVVGSFREDTFLEKSLSIVIFRTVSILESELISSFSLSSKKYKTKVSGEIFLETKEVEILFGKYLSI